MQDLSIERDTYLRLEKRLSKIFTITTAVFMTPNLFAIFGNLVILVIDAKLYYKILSIYYMGLYVVAISIYQSSAL